MRKYGMLVYLLIAIINVEPVKTCVTNLSKASQEKPANFECIAKINTHCQLVRNRLSRIANTRTANVVCTCTGAPHSTKLIKDG